AVEAVGNNLARNGKTALREHGDIDFAKAKKILSLALKFNCFYEWRFLAPFFMIKKLKVKS
ncbi:hypothetical protein, partial [Pseudoalteromonas undina]